MPPRTLAASLRARTLAAVAIAAGVLTSVSSAAAHDFWIIPDMFAFEQDSVVHASGRSGLRFPSGSAVQPARVADARLIGERGEWKITELTVEGGSLRLHQKPAAAGQYLIAVALTSRPTRSTPTRMLRFLRLEGGASEADRLERENALTGTDSVEFRSTSYGSAIMQVGRGGGRAFSKTTGFPLEFLPVNDPSSLHVGDTLHVKIVGGAKALANVGVYAGAAADSAVTTATGSAPAGSMSLTADANGVVHVPLHASGAWNLRAAYVARRADGASSWDVARATYVFGVGARH
ncbi:MAG: DUF4198 domain-containing protein [Gemmatimonadaceae bacterium]